MEFYELIEFLSQAQNVYSELLILVGIEQLKRNPLSNPEQFLELYFPPRHNILKTLNAEKENLLYKHNKGTKTKIKNIKRQSEKISFPLQLILNGKCFSPFLSHTESGATSSSILKTSKSEMSAIYPSLEDMKVDQTIRAQKQAYDAYSQRQNRNSLSIPSAPPLGASQQPSPINLSPVNTSKYPDLVDYMGLELSQEVIAANMPEYLKLSDQQVVDYSYHPLISPSSMAIAPLSGNSVGFARAGTTNGIRELILCKDNQGKIGLRVQSINKGIFVCVVVKDSPAAVGGLRFGDQILQIQGITVAGYTVDEVHKLLKKSGSENISCVIRDRPFERIVVLHKDSLGCVGFQFKNGKITSIVQDSSAARNGLLIDHSIIEIDGQNVVSLSVLIFNIS